jgi:PST family polysaccharide transporter
MTTTEVEATAAAQPLVVSALPPETHEIIGPDDHPPEPMLSGLMKKAAMWSGINAFALRLAQFSVGVVSARIIAPKQFGIYAVALTVYAIIINVNELGVSAALARTKRPVDEVAPTVATIAIASSSIFTAIMFFTAPALARLLGAPDAANSVRILSSVVVMGGITAVPYALLVRNFQQDKRFLADGSNVVASTIVVIALGLSGFGATALALSKVVGQLVSVVLLLSTIKPRYRPGWNPVYAREVLVYSLPLAAATIVEFTLGNVDYIVVGHVMGALALGYYMLAYNISGWPVSVFGLMINEVALPAFARAQDDRAGLSRRVAGAFALTAAVAMPVSAMCLALAHPLVAAVYGSRWSPAAAALALLGLFGSMRIVLTLFSNILAALGDSKGVLLLQAVWIAALIPALIVGVNWHGIVGAAVAQEVVVVVVVLPLALWLIQRAGGGRTSRLLSVTAFPAAAALVAGISAWAVSLVLPTPILQVIGGGLVGVGLYVLIVGKWARQLLKDARGHWNDVSTTSEAVAEEAPKPARGRHRWDKNVHGPAPRTAGRRRPADLVAVPEAIEHHG